MQLLKELLLEISSSNDTSSVTFFHGGRDLENNYKKVLGNKSGQTEHGVGLYLTASYSIAQRYAKGGRLYAVTFVPKNEISSISIPLSDVFYFLKTIRINNRSNLMKDLKDYEHSGTIKASYLNNLLINNNCITPSNSASFRQFFIDMGVGYIKTVIYGKVAAVIVDPSLIKSCVVVKPDEIGSDKKYPFEF